MKLMLTGMLLTAILGAFAVQPQARPEPRPTTQADVPRIVIVGKREHGAEANR